MKKNIHLLFLLISFLIPKKVFCLLPNVFYNEEIYNAKNIIISEQSLKTKVSEGDFEWEFVGGIEFCHIHIASAEFSFPKVIDQLIQKFKYLENIVFDSVYIDKDDKKTLYDNMDFFRLHWNVWFIRIKASELLEEFINL